MVILGVGSLVSVVILGVGSLGSVVILEVGSLVVSGNIGGW